MGIQSLSLLEGATVSATGGTAISFQPDGLAVPGGIHVVNVAEPDFRIRENITAKYKQPALQSDGKYSKSKNTVLLVAPKIIADGSTVFNLVEVRVEIHPETSAADAAALRKLGSQLLFVAALDAYYLAGSLV